MKEYKARHDLAERVIHRELCKKLKFDHTTKGCMVKPESVMENETLRIILDFLIYNDYLVPDKNT